MSVSESKLYDKIFSKQANEIFQKVPTLFEAFKAISQKDKKSFLISQEINFLLEARKKDKEGNPIVYHTKSQSLTKFLLRSAEKAGFIENFESKEAGEKSLMIEKLALGSSHITKKEKMYDMSFSIADKIITDEEIKKVLRVDDLDEKRFQITRDKQGNITSINQKLVFSLMERFHYRKNELPCSNNKMLKEGKEQNFQKELSSQVREVPLELKEETLSKKEDREQEISCK